MDVVYWILVGALIVLSFIGLIYPIIPSSVVLVGAFVLYGVLFTFEPLNWFFWLVQGLFVILLLVADHAANVFGVKKFGGSKAGMWGSTIGLLIGPFAIPAFGIILGPFIGAFIGEILVNRTSFGKAVKIGIGSVLGFIGSVVTKGVIQAAMTAYFLFLVLR